MQLVFSITRRQNVSNCRDITQMQSSPTYWFNHICLIILVKNHSKIRHSVAVGQGKWIGSHIAHVVYKRLFLCLS